jgi:hypothetical protein
MVFSIAGSVSMSRSAINGDIEGIKQFLAKSEDVNQIDEWG